MLSLSAAFTALVALSSPAFARVFITQPVEATVAQAGEALTVTWIDNGEAPTLAEMGVCSVDLCIGTTTQQEVVQNLAESVDVSQLSSVEASIDPAAGAPSGNYFIRFSSVNKETGATPFMSFSARFDVQGMTGTWSDAQALVANGTATTENATVSAVPSGLANATASVLPSTSSVLPSTSSIVASSSLAPSSSSQRPTTSSSSSSAAASASASASAAEKVLVPAGLAMAAAIAGYVAL